MMPKVARCLTVLFMALVALAAIGAQARPLSHPGHVGRTLLQAISPAIVPGLAPVPAPAPESALAAGPGDAVSALTESGVGTTSN